MQARGLEWLFRLSQEPARLLPRYLRYNPASWSRLRVSTCASAMGRVSRGNAGPGSTSRSKRARNSSRE